MMKRDIVALTVLAASLCVAPFSSAAGETQLSPSPGGVQSEPEQDEAQQIAGERQETLRVFTGKTLVVNSPDPLKRVSVTNEQIASAVIVSPNQILIHGLTPGAVTLLLWNEEEQMRSFELEVEIDLRSLRETLQSLYPRENVQVNQIGGNAVLTGMVSSPEISAQVEGLAKVAAPGVVNLLTTGEINQVVLLQVRFAEVNRTALRQLGANIISTGTLNTPGQTTTGQFGPLSGNLALAGIIGGGLQGFNTNFQLTDLLNIFVFRPDLNLGLTLRALEQMSLLQILAEPNLLASGGKEASFLAGGEFPVPIVQGGTVQTVSIQFKEFGVRLKFTANPMADGTIRLKVAPEVSTLDFANAVTLQGFVIPALSTRRAETEVELKNGQSFAIAGLIDNRVTKISTKIPWLGDVPFLGKLFRSENFVQNNSELLVMVTPQFVKGLDPGQLPVGPAFPIPLMDTQRFDGKIGEAPAARKPGNP